MTIDTNSIVSMTEANQNFSRVSRVAEKQGQAVIFKNRDALPCGQNRNGSYRLRASFALP